MAGAGKIDAIAMADLLGHWPTAEGPLYRLLAARIARLTDTGELPAACSAASWTIWRSCSASW
jgi:hypothetical protein